MMKRLIAVFLLLSISCETKNDPIEISADDYHNSVDKVREIMIHDIFSPPVASRIYAYPNIAAYEIIAQQNNDYKSLENQVTDVKAIPKNDSQSLNYQLAALIAHIDVSRRLIFSEDKSLTYRWFICMILFLAS